MARHRERGQSFLTRLRRDTAGNVIAMTAASLVPLIAMVGGAIDASRIYMSYTRLQQACDAGALAGRRAMANVKTLSATEQAKANEFFDFNFPAGTYQATGVTRRYSKGNDGYVVGAASAVMPTTIMKMFGYETVPLSVECQATLNIPNTDVMFVLDVTGSMAQTASGDKVAKIDGLKDAVKEFYKALGPGAASGPGRVRYGFVPYSSNVNVGRLLYKANPSFLVGGTLGDSYSYATRVADFKITHIASYGAEGAPYNNASNDTPVTWNNKWNLAGDVGSYKGSYGSSTQKTCDARQAPPQSNSNNGAGTTSSSSTTPAYPDDKQVTSYKTNQPRKATRYDYFYYSDNKTCYLIYDTGTFSNISTYDTNRPVTWTDRKDFVKWKYVDNATSTYGFVSSEEVVANPAYWTGYSDVSGINGDAPANFKWNGCIEEANTVNTIDASSSLTAPSNAYDLQIDLIPSSNETRWRPYLPQVQYERDSDWLYSTSWITNGFAACPRQAARLTSYATDVDATTKVSTAFSTYVDSLSPIGGTYHDIGLIWGARFLSPDGIFAADNRDSAAPGGYQVSRHIVFMTDGTLDTRNNANDPWGVNLIDGRIAKTTASSDDMNSSHDRRTQIICAAMKAKGYQVWVIGFGISQLSDTLKKCATDDSHQAVASKSDDLRKEFARIAQTIGGLRLSS